MARGPAETLSMDIASRSGDKRRSAPALAAAFLTGALATLAACGDEASSGPDKPPPLKADEVGAISGNHQHQAILTKAQIEAGAPVLLSIQGPGDHDHTVAFFTEDLLEIGKGKTVTRTSSNERDHEHGITFNPAP
jgi:hypothetical protein